MSPRLSLLLVLVAACSAPAPPPDLTRAERFEHDGRDEEALAAYGRAAETCWQVKDKALREAWCAAALLGKAETLERLGRPQEAARAYEAVPARLPDGEAPARALTAAAALRLRLGEDKAAYDLYWRVITSFPDQPAADEALRQVVRDGRTRNAKQLYDVLAGLRERLAGTAVDDNVLFTMATLARDDLGDGKQALALFDAYAKQFPDGALYDDALWEGAALARAAGDAEGALKRLRTLLATRERAYIVGSYHSVWLDDAVLAVGRIQRDDLHRDAAAARTFESLPQQYPTSVLRDDALYEAAVTWRGAGETARACRDLAALHERFPESQYELESAPKLRSELACGNIAPK